MSLTGKTFFTVACLLVLVCSTLLLRRKSFDWFIKTFLPHGYPYAFTTYNLYRFVEYPLFLVLLAAVLWGIWFTGTETPPLD